MERSRPITVVIVEDHAMVAESLGAALDVEPDLQVVGTATTVAEAQRVVPELAPDVVVMDFLLPDGDGATATAALRKSAPDTPVLLLTAVSGEEVVRRAIEAGCCGLVRKTEPVARVRSAIRRAAAGEAVFSPESLARLLDAGKSGQQSTSFIPLTTRELDVLRLLVAGCSTEAIADDLVLSLHTVRNHVRNLMQKLGAHSRLEAVAIALREGLVAVESHDEAGRT